jgi:hypothetical protein
MRLASRDENLLILRYAKFHGDAAIALRTDGDSFVIPPHAEYLNACHSDTDTRQSSCAEKCPDRRLLLTSLVGRDHHSNGRFRT